MDSSSPFTSPQDTSSYNLFSHELVTNHSQFVVSLPSLEMKETIHILKGSDYFQLTTDYTMESEAGYDTLIIPARKLFVSIQQNAAKNHY